MKSRVLNSYVSTEYSRDSNADEAFESLEYLISICSVLQVAFVFYKLPFLIYRLQPFFPDIMGLVLIFRRCLLGNAVVFVMIFLLMNALVVFIIHVITSSIVCAGFRSLLVTVQPYGFTATYYALRGFLVIFMQKTHENTSRHPMAELLLESIMKKTSSAGKIST